MAQCAYCKAEYEQQYSEALAELRSRGCKVASPSTAPDGIRRVQIDDFTACIDRLVFEKAWGQLIADQIMRKNPLPTKTSLPPREPKR
jgi:hypothetical protein